MNENDLINLKILPDKTIRFRFLLLGSLMVVTFVATIVIIVTAFFNLDNGLMYVGAAVLSLAASNVFAIHLRRHKEISTDAYAALRSHKDNATVKAYIDAVKATGREYVVRGEFETVVDYAKRVVPHKLAKAKLFDDSREDASIAQDEECVSAETLNTENSLVSDLRSERRERKAEAFENLICYMLRDHVITPIDSIPLDEYLIKAGIALHKIPYNLAHDCTLTAQQLDAIDVLDSTAKDGERGEWAMIMESAFNQAKPQKLDNSAHAE